ncbi:MAG TPA: hypothetical protein PLA68_12975, partial [Panacibacter sp.]|nr:hypothetical protein [Panacibacter sp.]
MKNLFTQNKLLFLFLSFILSTPVFAQYAKYIVQFTDKANSPYHLNNPQQYLSQRAVDRRIRYSIGVDSTDLPVNPSYIQQVVAQGAVNYLSQSKWLNQVLIYSTSTAAINAVNALPFVKSVRPVGQLINNVELPHPERFKETVTPFTETQKTQSTATS